MSCSVGCRYGSDPACLWLWCRPEATALIGPLAWEPLYAAGVALKSKKKKKSLEKEQAQRAQPPRAPRRSVQGYDLGE